MTFLNLSLGSPVVRAGQTATGQMGVVGARFIMAGGPSELVGSSLTIGTNLSGCHPSGAAARVGRVTLYPAIFN